MSAVRYQMGSFPPDSRLDWTRLVTHIGPAAAALARYDGILDAIPNRRVLLRQLTTQEALLSSRIEGTQASLSEVLEFRAGRLPASSDRIDEILEVENYSFALDQAETALEVQGLPLSQRVVLEAHKVLLQGARGHNKSPGEYRRIRVWIGTPGCTAETARFIPIEANRVPEAMAGWERYVHDPRPLDKLVQLAVIHAEFEAIHPFLDGNGRIGRLLLPLFLWQTKLIREPIFNISAWFESHRDAYYEALLAVSRDDDWTGWCRFFLKGVEEQAQLDYTKAHRILQLYNAMKIRIPEVTRSRFSVAVLDWIFENPIFSSTDFASSANFDARTATRLLTRLSEHDIVQLLAEGRGRRPALYLVPEVFDIIDA